MTNFIVKREFIKITIYNENESTIFNMNKYYIEELHTEVK